MHLARSCLISGGVDLLVVELKAVTFGLLAKPRRPPSFFFLLLFLLLASPPPPPPPPLSPSLPPQVALVREYAVLALERLVDVTTKDDQVLAESLRLLQSDPSAPVRRAVLSILGVTRHTLAAVIGACRDVDAATRRAALEKLTEGSRITHLNIDQRVLLVRGGLNDPSDDVKAATEKMVLAWLAQCDFDPIELLELLDVEMEPVAATEALDVVFRIGGAGGAVAPYALGDYGPDAVLKGLSAEDRGLLKEAASYEIDPTELGDTSAFYWRARVDFVKRMHDLGRASAEALDELQPPLKPFCEIIEKHGREEGADEGNSEGAFVVLQLLKMVKLLDVSEEAGLRSLKELVTNLLLWPDLPDALVPSACEAAQHACTASDDPSRDFVLWATETMADIRDHDMMDKTVGSEADAAAAAAGADGNDNDVDAWRLPRCLAISTTLLQHTKRWLRDDPAVGALLETTILPAMALPDEATREVAVRCIGLYCLLDPTGEQARCMVPVLMSTLFHDADEVRTTCLKAVFDLLLFCPALCTMEVAGEIVGQDQDEEGQEEGQEGEESSSSSSSSSSCTVARALLAALVDEDVEICTTAVEGFARLLLTGRLAAATGTADGAVEVLRIMLARSFESAEATTTTTTTTTSSSSSSSSTASDDDDDDEGDDDDAIAGAPDGTARMRSCLAHFFPAFAGGWGSSPTTARGAGAANRTLLLEAVPGTLGLVLDAPAGTAEASIPLDRAVESLMTLMGGDDSSSATEGVFAKAAGAGAPCTALGRLAIIFAREATALCSCGTTGAEGVAALRTLCKAVLKLAGAVDARDTWALFALKVMADGLIAGKQADEEEDEDEDEEGGDQGEWALEDKTALNAVKKTAQLAAKRLPKEFLALADGEDEEDEDAEEEDDEEKAGGEAKEGTAAAVAPPSKLAAGLRARLAQGTAARRTIRSAALAEQRGAAAAAGKKRGGGSKSGGSKTKKATQRRKLKQSR